MATIHIKETLSETTDINMIVVKAYCYIHYISLIPLDVIKLIAKFSERTRILFHISGIDLKNFMYTYKNTLSHSASMSFHGIDFNVSIYPNGHNWDDKNCVMMILKLMKMPTNVKSILVYYELFNWETYTIWKDTCSLSFQENKSKKQWDRITLSLNECNQKALNKLTFGCFLDILEIEYFENIATLKIIKTKTNVFTEYHFEIDAYIFKYFTMVSTSTKPYDPKIIYSPNFGYECWCLKVIPFSSDRLHEKLYLILKLLRLPTQIKKIKIRYEVKIFCDEMLVKSFGTDIIVLPFKVSMLMSIPSYAMQKFESISFYVNIELLEVYNLEYQKIARKHWDEYDILINEKSRMNIDCVAGEKDTLLVKKNDHKVGSDVKIKDSEQCNCLLM